MEVSSVRRTITEKWRRRRDEWARLAVHPSGPAVCDEVLLDLEALVAEQEAKWVRASEAAHISGYSEAHLRRLAREDRVVADRRGRSWWYLVASLPRKPRFARVNAFDPTSAAAEVVAATRKERVNVDEETP